MARPNKGLDHVDGLQGEAQQKQRLRCILSALFGLMSVGEACLELGIGPTYFRLLRIRVLQACLDALAPRLARTTGATVVAYDRAKVTWGFVQWTGGSESDLTAALTVMPAALAALTPLGLSSMTTQRAGSAPIFAAA